MIIAVDFDGTCVTHEFPKVGKDIGAVPVLKKLIEKGHKIILYTMRSHPDKNNQGKTLSGEIVSNDTLQDAIHFIFSVIMVGAFVNLCYKKFSSVVKGSEAD